MYPDGYKPPILTVDTVVFEVMDGVLSVLLIRRSNEPFKDMWALPGGYCAAGETTHGAMARIIETKAGVKTKSLGLVEQLYTFDTVARDPRGHAVSVTYMGLGINITPAATKHVQTPRFFPVDQLPKLAYDHAAIIVYAQHRLQNKITYTNAVFALLPKLFTLSQLQSTYEAIIGHPIDKRNFRKKFLTLDLVEATSEMYKEGAHRPARLFTFKKQALVSLSRDFE